MSANYLALRAVAFRSEYFMRIIFKTILFVAFAIHLSADEHSRQGLVYSDGWGVPQEYTEAVRWYRLAVEQGYGGATAKFNLGNMYRDGHGATLDYEKAIKWYRLAAEQGHTEAQSNLGVMYALGNGVLQDNVLAYQWFSLAAADGNELGSKNRNIIAKRMTASESKKAQAMARKCMNSDYQDCGY